MHDSSLLPAQHLSTHHICRTLKPQQPTAPADTPATRVCALTSLGAAPGILGSCSDFSLHRHRTINTLHEGAPGAAPGHDYVAEWPCGRGRAPGQPQQRRVAVARAQRCRAGAGRRRRTLPRVCLHAAPCWRLHGHALEPHLRREPATSRNNTLLGTVCCPPTVRQRQERMRALPRP